MKVWRMGGKVVIGKSRVDIQSGMLDCMVLFIYLQNTVATGFPKDKVSESGKCDRIFLLKFESLSIRRTAVPPNQSMFATHEREV